MHLASCVKFHQGSRVPLSKLVMEIAQSSEKRGLNTVGKATRRLNRQMKKRQGKILSVLPHRPIVIRAWYEKEQYEKLLQVSETNDMPGYSEWHSDTMNIIEYGQCEVFLVPVNVDDLLEWCQKVGVQNDLYGRTLYARALYAIILL